jgi:hypothetical protein
MSALVPSVLSLKKTPKIYNSPKRPALENGPISRPFTRQQSLLQNKPSEIRSDLIIHFSLKAGNTKRTARNYLSGSHQVL